MIKRFLLAFTAFATLGITGAATAAESFWSKAGRDFSKATDTVSDTAVETSQEAWSDTKSAAGTTWDKTKEVSGDAWDATKEAVHDGAEYVEEKTE